MSPEVNPAYQVHWPTSAEYRGGIPYLLATFLLQQPRTLLAFLLPQGCSAGSGTACYPPGIQGLPWQSCFPASCPQYVLLPGIIPLHVWDSVLSLHEIRLCLVLPKSLNSGTTIWCINAPLFHFICELAEGGFCPITEVINEGVEQYWPQC